MSELLGSYFIETWELVLRLVLAAGLGFLVGLDRSIKNKPLGFRPFMLVALGACLFSVTILELGSGTAGSNGIDPVDVGRVMPGMAVQASINTGSQSLLSFMVRPVAASLRLAFAER